MFNENDPQMPTTTDTGRSDAAVREDILAAASAEFAAHGRKGVSVRTIATRAGVTAAMINYYYGSKQALYDVVVEHAQDRLFRNVSEAIQEHSGDGLAAQLAAVYFDFLAEERDLQRLLLHEILEDGKGVQQLVRKYVAPLRVLVENHFGDDDDTYQAAISLFGAVAGYFLYAPVLGALRGVDPLTPERLAKRRRHVMAVATLLQEM